MNIRPLRLRLIGILATTFLFTAPATAADENAFDSLRRYTEQREAIYEHMARYGINREDMAAMRRLYQQTPHTNPYVKIAAEKVLKPGEHYRFELDDHILTLLIPDAPYGQSWIVPYANTRQPDPDMAKELAEEKGRVKIANIMWNYGTGIYPLYFGWQGIMAMTASYSIIPKGKYAADKPTPEALRQRASEGMKLRIPSQAEIDHAIHTRSILNGAGNRIFLDAETIVINGRVWVRNAMNKSYGRLYAYKTVLSSDRMLGIVFLMPQYNYNANPDSAGYPAALKRAFADMEAMVASFRITKQNDDGAPDPFVIERVDPAPLPVREKLPTP
jgi:hypothetical protein